MRRQRAAAPGLPGGRRAVRRRLLPLLRGHRPVVAGPQPRLALPLRARRPGPPRPRGVDRRGLPRLPALRRAQPAPDAGQERPAPPGGERRVALPAHHRVVHPAGRRGPGRGRAPAPADHRVATGEVVRQLPAVLPGPGGPRASVGRRPSATPSWPRGRSGDDPVRHVGRAGRASLQPTRGHLAVDPQLHSRSTRGSPHEGRRLRPLLVDRRRRRAVRRRHRGGAGRRSRRAPAGPRRRRPRVARRATAPRPLGGRRRRARRRPRRHPRRPPPTTCSSTPRT